MYVTIDADLSDNLLQYTQALGHDHHLQLLAILAP